MTLQGYIVGTKGNTGRGIASIVENADYTITINLTDGTSFTTAPIAGFTAVEFDENYDLVVTKTDGTTEIVETDIADYNALLEGYKNEAYSSMQGAVNSASSASSSATSASVSATDAATSEGQAYNHATSAQTAKTAAEYAQGKAEDAQSAAETAQDKAEDAQDAAETAQTAAEAAQTAAETAQASAQSSATDAHGSWSRAEDYAEAALESSQFSNQCMTDSLQYSLKSEGYAKGEQNGTPVTSDSPYYENNAKYYSEEAAASAASLTVDDELDGSSTNPVQNKVIKDELDSKANVDGYYESLGSGTADQLASNIYEEDNIPYNFRTSGGSIDIGDRETDMLVGGTVAWNQLIQDGNFPNDTTKWSSSATLTITNNKATISKANQTNAYIDLLITANDAYRFNYLSTHKYFCTCMMQSDNRIAWYPGSAAGAGGYAYSQAGVFSTKKDLALVWSPSNDGKALCAFRCYTGANATADLSMTVENVNIIDLTAMFGSTIADYIYSLEQANAGAGVAWFKKLFPKPYYAYNAGELMSVQAASHDMVGFNAWDEEWEQGGINQTTGANTSNANAIRSKNYIRVVPNATYYVKAPIAVRGYWYDADKNYINTESLGVNTTFTVPSGACYLRFIVGNSTTPITTYGNNICINLSWDGERDGEYEAYVKHSYALDSDLVLRGIPKLDANGKLYYDGDEYASDGTVGRKYGEITFDGSDDENIVVQTQYNGTSAMHTVFRVDVPSMKTQTVGSLVDGLYVFGNYVAVYVYDTTTDERWTIRKRSGQSQVFIFAPTSLGDVSLSDFKTRLASNKLMLVYELATPTTETADPYTNPQIVNDFGTEEYVDYPYSQGTRDVAIPVGHQTQYMANLKAKLEMSPNSPEGEGDYIVRQTNGENEYVTLASNATIQDIIARLEALEGGE